MFTSTVFIFLLNEGDDAFVGKFLGTLTLGVYTLAFHLANLAVYNITFITSKVVMPAYASIQDNKPRLKKAYFKIFRYVSVFAFPASLGILILAPELVPIVYSEKWNPMIYPLMILCIYGLSRSLIATTGEVFKAVGKPKLLQKVTFIQLIVLAIIIYPLTSLYGLVGTCLAVTLAALSVHWTNFYYVSKIIGASFKDFIIALKAPTISATIMTVSIYLTKQFIPINNVLVLILFVLLGAALYFLFLLLLDRSLFGESKYILRSLSK
jgi:PST family polysaccharide transporter/lipopolysaccharide exporter